MMPVTNKAPQAAALQNKPQGGLSPQGSVQQPALGGPQQGQQGAGSPHVTLPGINMGPLVGNSMNGNPVAQAPNIQFPGATVQGLMQAAQKRANISLSENTRVALFRAWQQRSSREKCSETATGAGNSAETASQGAQNSQAGAAPQMGQQPGRMGMQGSTAGAQFNQAAPQGSPGMMGNPMGLMGGGLSNLPKPGLGLAPQVGMKPGPLGGFLGVRKYAMMGAMQGMMPSPGGSGYNAPPGMAQQPPQVTQPGQQQLNALPSSGMQQPQPGAGGPPQPMAPMQTPPPQPLPANPRMTPPRPMTPIDQQQQGMMGDMMAAKIEPDVNDTDDMNSDLMAAGAKIGRDSNYGYWKSDAELLKMAGLGSALMRFFGHAPAATEGLMSKVQGGRMGQAMNWMENAAKGPVTKMRMGYPVAQGFSPPPGAFTKKILPKPSQYPVAQGVRPPGFMGEHIAPDPAMLEQLQQRISQSVGPDPLRYVKRDQRLQQLAAMQPKPTFQGYPKPATGDSLNLHEAFGGKPEWYQRSVRPPTPAPAALSPYTRPQATETNWAAPFEIDTNLGRMPGSTVANNLVRGANTPFMGKTGSDKPVFSTYKQAEEYLRDVSRGHGKIDCSCGQRIRSCRCMAKVSGDHGHAIVTNGCEKCGGEGTGWFKKRSWDDLLPGGKADHKTPSMFNPKALAHGAKVEQEEHTSSKHKATEIAMDHLTESPRYYTALDRMEARLKKDAAQKDVTTASPKRSATGESEGLSYQHKPDHYMQGQDAWNSVGEYMKSKADKKPNPFLGKHADDAPQFNISPPATVLPQMGNTRLAGLGLGGLGAAITGAGYGLGKGVAGLRKAFIEHNPFHAGVRNAIQNYSDAIGGAASPAEKMLSYVQHGHDVMSRPIFRGRATGRDVMERLWKNPIFNAIVKATAPEKELGFGPQRAQHYAAFAKSPVHGYEQLAGEMFGKDPQALLPHGGGEGVHDAANKALEQYQKLRSGAGKATDWSSMPEETKKFFQRRFDSADAAKNQAAGAANRTASAAGRLSEIPNEAQRITRQNLFNQMRSDPQLAGISRRSGITDPMQLHTLPAGEQMQVIKSLTNAPHGGDVANAFGRDFGRWADEYARIGKTVTGPQPAVNAVRNGMRGAQNKLRSVVKGGLGATAAGAGLYGLGHYLDHRQADQINQEQQARFMEALGMLPQVKQSTALDNILGLEEADEHSKDSEIGKNARRFLRRKELLHANSYARGKDEKVAGMLGNVAKDVLSKLSPAYLKGWAGTAKFRYAHPHAYDLGEMVSKFAPTSSGPAMTGIGDAVHDFGHLDKLKALLVKGIESRFPNAAGAITASGNRRIVDPIVGGGTAAIGGPLAYYLASGAGNLLGHVPGSAKKTFVDPIAQALNKQPEPKTAFDWSMYSRLHGHPGQFGGGGALMNPIHQRAISPLTAMGTTAAAAGGAPDMIREQSLEGGATPQQQAPLPVPQMPKPPMQHPVQIPKMASVSGHRLAAHGKRLFKLEPRKENTVVEEKPADQRESLGTTKMSEFAQGFIERCLSNGMTLPQIKQAIDAISDEFGKEAQDELRDGMEKLAAGWSQVRDAGAKLLPWLGKAEQKVAPAVMPAARRGAQTILRPGMQAAPAAERAVMSRTAQTQLVPHPANLDHVYPLSGAQSAAATGGTGIWQNVKNRASGAWNNPTFAAGRGYAGNAGNAALGFMGGYNDPLVAGQRMKMDASGQPVMGPDGQPVMEETGNPMARFGMGALGAMANLNPKWSRRGIPGLAMQTMQGRTWGEGAGYGTGLAVDVGARLAGYNTNMADTLGTLGRWGGTMTGAGKGLRGMTAPGTMLANNATARSLSRAAGVPMQQFGEGMQAISKTPLDWGRRFMGSGGTTSWSSVPKAMKLGIGAGGLYAGSQALGNIGHNMQQKADEYVADRMRQVMPVMSQYAQNEATRFMQDRGMLNEQGKFDPTQMVGQNLMQHGGQFLDSALSHLGIQPGSMSPVQKMMLFGGGALGAGGLAMGSPALAGIGGLSMLGGTPWAQDLMHRARFGQNPGQMPSFMDPMMQAQLQNYQMQHAGGGAPQARNELEAQQQHQFRR